MGFEIENGVLIRYHKENGVRSVTVPDGVTAIGPNAFCRMKAVTEVHLPESVVRIDKEAFRYCTGLQHITLPDSLITMEEGAFSWCNHLWEVTLPPKLEVIPDRAFLGCAALSEVHLPEQLREIGVSAFERCQNLSGLELPEGLVSIGERAFLLCRRIGTLRIPESVEHIGGLAVEYKPTVHIPDDCLPALGKNAAANDCIVVGNGILYKYCGEESVFRIPTGVRKIAAGALASSMHTVILVPDTLAYIDPDAFGSRHLLRLCRGDVSVPLRYYRGSNTQRSENRLLTDFLTEADISAREELFQRMRTADYKIPAAVFMAAAYGLPFYQEYLRHIGKRAAEYLIGFDDADTLLRILPHLPISQKNIDNLITFAISGQHLHCQNLLLHHKSETVGYKDAEAYFKL